MVQLEFNNDSLIHTEICIGEYARSTFYLQTMAGENKWQFKESDREEEHCKIVKDEKLERPPRGYRTKVKISARRIIIKRA